MNRLDEIIAGFLLDLENGKNPDREELLQIHPEFRKDLEEFFRGHDALNSAMEPIGTSGSPDRETPRGDPVEMQKFPAADSDNFPAESEQRSIGKYRIIKEIDRGGMGVVYRAVDQDLGRVVALKMIRAGRLASDLDVRRFQAESRAVAKLDHPGIVPVYDVGCHEGHPFFAMAFVDGVKLDEYCRDHQPTVEEACQIIREIAEAVQHAHDHGVVHRDLKPANVLIDSSGHARIMDFGLAKNLDSDEGLTGTGEIVGTVNYMSPEQAAGHNDRIGPATDIYSLGAILYYLLAGRAPFETDNPVDTLLRILDSDAPAPEREMQEVPRDVGSICLHCLEKSPADRYQTAAELIADLDRFQRGEPVDVARFSPRTWFLRWSRREPGLVGHLIGLGLIELMRAFSYGIEIFFLGGQLPQYLRYTVIIGIWAFVCILLQKVQNRMRIGIQVVSYFWAAIDIGFLTIMLLMAEGPIGPLYIAYPLVIVVSGFFSHVPLVVFSSALCIVSYLVVFLSNSEGFEYVHYGVVGMASIGVVGYIVAQQVHRIRILNRILARPRDPHSSR